MKSPTVCGNLILQPGDSAFIFADGGGILIDKVIVESYDEKRCCFRGWTVPVSTSDPAFPFPVEFSAGQVIDVLKGGPNAGANC